MKLAIKLCLEEVDKTEYSIMRDRVKWIINSIPEDESIGFARMEGGIRFRTARRMLKRFKKDPLGDKVSVKIPDGDGWKKTRKRDLTEEEIAKIIKMNEGTRGLIYLHFSNPQKIELQYLDLGFGDVGGNMVSVYGCFPGIARGQDYTWKGSEEDFAKIHALRY